MHKDKLMLVLRIVQCLQGKINVGMTTLKSIPYVLHCCGIDLGLEFKSSQKGPYSSEFNQLCKDWESEGLYITQRSGSTKLVNVTNKFNISNLSFTDTEKQISNEIYRAYRKFRNVIDAEMFTLLLDRRVDGVHFKSRYDEDRFSGDMSRLNQVLDDFIEAVRLYIGLAKSDFRIPLNQI